MTTIPGLAKRFSLVLPSEGSLSPRVAGAARRTRRAFSPSVDGLPPRIAPAVLILPAQDPAPPPVSPYT